MLRNARTPCGENLSSCRGSVLRVSGAATNIERAFRDVLFICLQIYCKTLHFVQNITNVTFFTKCTKS